MNVNIDLAKASPALLQQLANTPLMPPPPGKISNFTNPSTQAALNTWTMGSLLVFTIVLFLNRLYIKTKLMRTWDWDDTSLSIGMVLGCADVGLKEWGVQTGLIGRHVWDVSVLRFLQPNVGPFFYTALTFQCWNVMFVRASFFLLYLRLFGRIHFARVFSWIGFVFVFVAHATVGILAFAVTRPYSFAAQEQYIFNITVAIGAVGIASDLIIFVLPFLVIGTLALPTGKKIRASLIFLTAICAIACSVLNLHYRIKLKDSKDFLWDAIPVSILGVAEILLGIICACIPTLAFGFRQDGSIYQKLFLPSNRLTSRSSTIFTSRPDSWEAQLKSHRFSLFPRRSGNFRESFFGRRPSNNVRECASTFSRRPSNVKHISSPIQPSKLQEISYPRRPSKVQDSFSPRRPSNLSPTLFGRRPNALQDSYSPRRPSNLSSTLFGRRPSDLQECTSISDKGPSYYRPQRTHLHTGCIADQRKASAELRKGSVVSLNVICKMSLSELKTIAGPEAPELQTPAKHKYGTSGMTSPEEEDVSLTSSNVVLYPPQPARQRQSSHFSIQQFHHSSPPLHGHHPLRLAAQPLDEEAQRYEEEVDQFEDELQESSDVMGQSLEVASRTRQRQSSRYSMQQWNNYSLAPHSVQPLQMVQESRELAQEYRELAHQPSDFRPAFQFHRPRYSLHQPFQTDSPRYSQQPPNSA